MSGRFAAAILGVCLLACAGDGSGAEPPLRLTIAPVLPAYEAGDLIAVSLTLTNAGREPLTVLDPSKMATQLLLAGGVVSFGIQDAQGRTSDLTGAIMDYFPGDRARAQLAPGASLAFRMVINDTRAPTYYPVAAPGRYRVTARYFGLATPNEATPDPGDITFNSSVASNTITIDVVAASTRKGAPRKQVSINPRDQACRSDADCAEVQTVCNGCACNEAVSATRKEGYVNAFHELCADFHGPQCDYSCRAPYPRCVGGRCVMTNRASGSR